MAGEQNRHRLAENQNRKKVKETHESWVYMEGSGTGTQEKQRRVRWATEAMMGVCMVYAKHDGANETREQYSGVRRSMRQTSNR